MMTDRILGKSLCIRTQLKCRLESIHLLRILNLLREVCMTTFVQEVCKIEILFLVSTIVYLS